MGQKPPPPHERRRDARLTPRGRVRAQRPGQAKPIEGELVDVSARGVRFRWEAGTSLGDGPLAIEILLEDPANPGGAPRVVLDGRGRAIWEDDLGGEGRQAGIHFDAPVDVRRNFPEVVIF